MLREWSPSPFQAGLLADLLEEDTELTLRRFSTGCGLPPAVALKKAVSLLRRYFKKGATVAG